jgi:Bacteriophage replication protein O
MRDQEYSLSARIILWVLRNTYGWSRKTTVYTWSKIAREIEARREHVSRAGLSLLQKKRLYIDNKKIGLQKDHDKWTKRTIKGSPPWGAPSKTMTAPSEGHPTAPSKTLTEPNSHGSSNAREKQVLKQEENKGKATAAPPPPGGSTATAYHEALRRFGKMAQQGKWFGHDPAYEQMLAEPDGWKYKKDLDRLEEVYDTACKKNEQRRIDEAHERHMKDVRETEARLAIEAKAATKGKYK